MIGSKELAMRLVMRDDSDACGVNPTDRLGLRVGPFSNFSSAGTHHRLSQIGAVFVIMVTSMFGTFFPVITKRSSRLGNWVPGWVFEMAK
jgi:zinc transporter 1/2/3